MLQNFKTFYNKLLITCLQCIYFNLPVRYLFFETCFSDVITFVFGAILLQLTSCNAQRF